METSPTARNQIEKCKYFIQLIRTKIQGGQVFNGDASRRQAEYPAEDESRRQNQIKKCKIVQTSKNPAHMVQQTIVKMNILRSQET